MGRTVFVAAALLIAGSAAAQTPETPPPASAQDLLAQGREIAARGDFVTAIGVFTRALEIEPANWEIKLALADAERGSGQCDKAAPRYKELFDGASESDKPRVKAAMTQCPNLVVIEEKAPIQLPPPPPEPKVIVREGSLNPLTTGLVVGAGFCFGTAVGLYIAARGSANDADDARSFADHERISTRADREKIASVVFLAGAVGLGGWAIYRIKFQNSERTEVAVTPTADGGAMIVRGSW